MVESLIFEPTMMKLYYWQNLKSLYEKNSTLWGISKKDGGNDIYLRQGMDLSVQEYTIKFWRQAMMPIISLDDQSTMTKYTSSLHAQIQIKLSQFKVYDISIASYMVMIFRRMINDHGRWFDRTYTSSWRGFESIIDGYIKGFRLKSNPLSKGSRRTFHYKHPSEARSRWHDFRHRVQKNLISASLVKKLGLKMTSHLCPYLLGWLHDDVEAKINEQWKIQFTIIK